MTRALLDAAEIESEVKYAYSFYEQKWRSLPSTVVEQVSRYLITLSTRLPPLSTTESGIVTLLKPKTTALFADRVWLQFPGEDERLEFAFGLESPISVRLGALFAFIHEGGDHPAEEDGSVVEPLTGHGADFVVMTEGDLSRDYCMRRGAHISPLYASPSQRDADYKPGNYAAIVSIIENVAVVSEQSLTWDQVLEFRRDTDARSAYHRFVHWLDKEMVDKPPNFIRDEVNARLESYEWALRKHGLQTVLGTLQRTMGSGSVVAASAATVAVQTLANQPVMAALAGVGLLVGQAAIHASTALIQREDVLVANRDIAFVHEVRNATAQAKRAV